MVWLIVATFAASFIKGVCGFANTLVFTTILSFSFNNIQITPMDLIIGYPANMIIAWKERRQINWRISLPVAAFRSMLWTLWCRCTAGGVYGSCD